MGEGFTVLVLASVIGYGAYGVVKGVEKAGHATASVVVSVAKGTERAAKVTGHFTVKVGKKTGHFLLHGLKD